MDVGYISGIPVYPLLLLLTEVEDLRQGVFGHVNRGCKLHNMLSMTLWFTVLAVVGSQQTNDRRPSDMSRLDNWPWTQQAAVSG